jgi:hypothetical protein
MSTKVPSPLLGYNNNVRHKGKVFHIQTEDSGVKYGHIITHLFMDGGRILKSVKTGYSEYIGNERMGDIVREMMKQQHKAMFIALRDGRFDTMADGSADASIQTQAVVAESPPKPTPSPQAIARAAPPPLSPVVVPADARTASAARLAAISAAIEDGVDAPATLRQPLPAASELTLDIDALERAASAAQGASPAMRAASDLPPPPANLFREKSSTGRYRVTPVPPVAAAPADAGAAGRTSATGSERPSPQSAPPRRASQPSSPSPGERRYAPTRPAAIFGQARPQPNKSVFGEDLISDKSLDEVILSYLAEDLDEKK